jgi:hypothetical protein
MIGDLACGLQAAQQFALARPRSPSDAMLDGFIVHGGHALPLAALHDDDAVARL